MGKCRADGTNDRTKDKIRQKMELWRGQLQKRSGGTEQLHEKDVV